mmetsp:Transcript_21473/g.50034  ORF Transcript_21473/g.50034 Transcript_21473/m.50034 type:complete len:359 (-) Transcript_21473:7-1083(-)|eukprot:CAMPEP_0178417094 /NCGR_PEP_ID=MMETSP0689_2-20121128/24400_1 /TAXON_ID=160604 /ORGANISM="Amphidinium massartii, Strain CS-259" /LENGTH=358 /DNA_ID=CAMNT_0020038455 /DNA_START=145 /DNA_END=1218 /DNA_ORIENTATION=-
MATDGTRSSSIPEPMAEPEHVPEGGLLTDQTLLECVVELAPWDETRFIPVAVLQKCPRNRGEVILMEDRGTGHKVAVKRMPNEWVCRRPQEFLEKHSEETEVPWMDMGVTKWLNEHDYARCVEFVGAFEGQGCTSFAMGFCEGGDLFSYMENLMVTPEGPSREDLVWPLAVQLYQAVNELHALGIAHCDLSLENILLARNQAGQWVLKIVDFGMSTCQRNSSGHPRGKPSYICPEMHTAEAFNTFQADAFSCGVMLYALVARDYPWTSTRPGGCKCFEFIRQQGFLAFLRKRRVPVGKERKPVAEIISEGLANLLNGLLAFDPEKRLSMNRDNAGRAGSIWDLPWLEQGPRGGAAAVQ